jgi:dihydrofolate synthase/folylpolyglutamate synthase
MNHLSYRDAWSFLDRLQFFKIKLGLDSMNQFLDSLGHPHKRFPSIHIGGTNGKGSVGATLLSILHASGSNVGLYTSPHLSSVRERFRVGNRYISESEFAENAEKIIRILDGRQITYFEFTTTLAMLWFADMQVDLAILEVGLGGRLDATNVVEPMVSVVTNVSMDHEQYLGNTIIEVAREKAGIIKPGVPLVTGETADAPLAVLTSTAEKLKSPAFIMGRDFKGLADPTNKNLWSYEGLTNSNHENKTRLTDLPLAMKGDYQVDNASVALAALEAITHHFPVRELHIRNGLEKVAWPGRLEEFWLDGQGKILRVITDRHAPLTHILLDGAHNPAGASALKKSLLTDFSYNRLVLIWASMADKDMNGTLHAIAPLSKEIIFTQPEAERSATPEVLFNLLPKYLQSRASCAANVKDAIRLAINKLLPGDMICIAGSLYLVGKARQILCGELVQEQ